MILPGYAVGPIQLIREGSDGLASRRHGAARRLESRQPHYAQLRGSTVTNERWPQVKALFQTAVQRPTKERGAFLAAATYDDRDAR